MNDVAQAAGVSQTTVSFVVNEVSDAGITEETKKRVLDAVEKLGYRPRIPKRFKRQSGFICLVVDNVLSSPHGNRLVQGVQDEAWARGMSVIVEETGFPGQPDSSTIAKLYEIHLELMIYATLAHERITPPRSFYERSVVLLNCSEPKGRLASIVPDEREAEKRATTILLDAGHTRIGFIGGPKFEIGVATMTRFDGYKDALEERGIELDESLVTFGADLPDAGHDHALQLLDRKDPPTALVCYNDQTAMGAYQAADELGLAIPHDLAVIGFDNLELLAGFVKPGLSTMELPHYEMGQRAVRCVLDDGTAGAVNQEQQRVECPYIARGSA
jgi:LacI family transcriptional regulator